MSPIDEESSPLSRLYEAPCPKVGAPLTQPIPLTLGMLLVVLTCNSYQVYYKKQYLSLLCTITAIIDLSNFRLFPLSHLSMDIANHN